MKFRVGGINSLFLVLVVFSSLISMFALTRMDNIIHQDLYRYGLQFSYSWAMPYWTMTTLIFAMCWFNIIVSAFQFHALLYRRKEAEVIPQREALKTQTTYRQPIEEKPAETAEPETKKTIAPPIEVELEIQKEGEEAEKLIEAPQEEAKGAVEEITPQEYVETELPEEVEETRPTETMETEPEEPSMPPMETEETQEPVETQLQEENSYAPTEEEREQEEMPRETVETETQELPPLTPEIETETTEKEETQEYEPPSEETGQQEDELTETYST